MSVQFNRAVQVRIGPRGTLGVLVDALRVTFNITKSLEPFPNSSTIEITNLSATSRALIEEKRSVVVLSAGYGTDLKNIFIGDIARISTKRVGPDVITEIEAGDGEVAFKDAKLDASFAPGTRFSQVLSAITSSLGLTQGQVKGVNGNDQFQQGLTLSGPSRNHLDTLTRRQRLEWSIQDNQLQILPVDEATDETAIVLNGSTGLVGTPYKTKVVNENLLKKKDGVQAESGVSCVALLNAEIRPGRRIKLESEFINGVFTVRECVHVGDTHGNAWYTKIEAR